MEPNARRGLGWTMMVAGVVLPVLYPGPIRLEGLLVYGALLSGGALLVWSTRVRKPKQ